MDLLLVDKYRPKSLQKLSYNHQTTQVLSQLAQTQDFPHIIFYGPEGSGKKTRAYAFLARIFGDHVFRLREEQRIIKPQNSSTNIEFSIFTSNYHIELTPSDNDHNDRHIVMNVVKEIAANTNVENKNGKGFKVLIINEADRLTKEAQGALRRTMEKYMKNCRMILMCTHVHKLIQPIRSRCINFRIAAPQPSEILSIFEEILRHEPNGQSFNDNTLNYIANNCGRNLRQALIQLQLSRHAKNFDGTLSPLKNQIKTIVNRLIKEQSVQVLKQVRDNFYDLLVNCVEGQLIVREMLNYLMEQNELAQEQKIEILHQASEHQRSLLSGSKTIIHLESFAAHVMELILISKNKRMNIE